MSFQLYADEFEESDQQEFARLNCGDEPWARAATEWIQGSDVVDSIKQHGTRVWVFRTEADEVIGFGSIGPSQWQWPPPDGERGRQLMIPQLGISIEFRGQPPDPKFRFSNQIMEHLIEEADQWAAEIRKTKPPKKHVKLLILHVHRDNASAQRLYQKFDFVRLPEFERNNHFAMYRRLCEE